MSVSELPDSYYLDEIKKEEKFVYDLITNAIKDGKNEISFNGIALSSITEQSLIKKGYCVETTINRRNIFPVLMTCILWKLKSENNEKPKTISDDC